MLKTKCLLITILCTILGIYILKTALILSLNLELTPFIFFNNPFLYRILRLYF